MAVERRVKPGGEPAAGRQSTRPEHGWPAPGQGWESTAWTREEVRRRVPAVLESSPGVTFVLDPDARILFASLKVAGPTGHRQDLLRGRDFFATLVPPSIREDLKKTFLQAILAGEPFAPGLFQIDDAGGGGRLLQWKTIPLFGAGRRVSEVILTGQDVADCFGGPNAAGVFPDYLTPGLFVVQEGKFSYLNARAAAVTGYHPGDTTGSDWSVHVHPGDRALVRSRAARMLKGRGNTPYEYRILAAGNQTKWLLETVTPVIYLGRRATLGWFFDVTARRETEEAVRQSEEMYRAIFETTGTAMFMVGADGRFTLVNSECERVFGWTREDLYGQHWTRFVVPEDLPLVRKHRRKRLCSREDASDRYEFRIFTRNGSVRNVLVHSAVLPGTREVVISLSDITEKKLADQALRESENTYRSIFENTGTAMAIIKDDGCVSLVNHEFENMSGYTREDLEGKRKWPEFVMADDLPRLLEYHRLRRSDPGLAPRQYELRLVDRHQVLRDFLLTAAVIPESAGSVISLIDITERKMMEEKLRFLGMHDPLTGLYNRAHFEQRLRDLAARGQHPLGLIICDLDGLKLINDTLGHQAGDRLLTAAAAAISEGLTDKASLARVGGDEFSILMEDATRDALEQACARIFRAVETHNAVNPDLPLGIAAGFALSPVPPTDEVALFREADNDMYRKKTGRSLGSRASIPGSFTRAMDAREGAAAEQTERLVNLTIALALAAGYPRERIENLKLLARFRDIGMLGVPDRIAAKPSRLSRRELAEVRKHCEVGRRIAQAAPDLAAIADWIFQSHEWWNGEGYPLGLRGDQIPLECRLLAITSAYVAMTSGRPYRKAFSSAQALHQIRNNAGLQFDPQLTRVFLELLEDKL